MIFRVDFYFYCDLSVLFSSYFLATLTWIWIAFSLYFFSVANFLFFVCSIPKVKENDFEEMVTMRSRILWVTARQWNRKRKLIIQCFTKTVESQKCPSVCRFEAKNCLCSIVPYARSLHYTFVNGYVCQRYHQGTVTQKKTWVMHVIDTG